MVKSAVITLCVMIVRDGHRCKTKLRNLPELFKFCVYLWITEYLISIKKNYL
jgi:hypothetical protein